MTAEWQRLEAALVCLRDPLSRIALALARLDDVVAKGGPISKAIQDAVSEIDIRIEDTLASLRPKLGPGNSPSDVRTSVSELVEELRPVLGARGIELALSLPDERIFSDGPLVRRVICRLLLGVGCWMHHCTGRIEIALFLDGRLLGVRIQAQSAEGPVGEGRRDVLGPIRGFALGEELSIESQEELDRGRATVTAWLGRVLEQ